MNSYDIYLFDLDGTLTNTAPTWIGIFRDCLADLGITGLTDQKIASHTHNWHEVITLGVPEASLEAFIQKAYQYANERLPLAPFYEGVELLLQTLRGAGKRTGIFTSMDRPILEPLVAHHKLDSLVDIIVAGTDVPKRKPHPAGIHAALKMLSIPPTKPHTIVYIGDKDTDILTAHNAGIDSILFYPTDHHAMYDETSLLSCKPSHTIRQWQDLIDTLRSPLYRQA